MLWRRSVRQTAIASPQSYSGTCAPPFTMVSTSRRTRLGDLARACARPGRRCFGVVTGRLPHGNWRVDNEANGIFPPTSGPSSAILAAQEFARLRDLKGWSCEDHRNCASFYTDFVRYLHRLEAGHGKMDQRSREQGGLAPQDAGRWDNQGTSRHRPQALGRRVAVDLPERVVLPRLSHLTKQHPGFDGLRQRNDGGSTRRRHRLRLVGCRFRRCFSHVGGARNWHVSGALLCSLRNSISRKHFIVFLTAALLKYFCRKNLSPQLVAVLCSWRCCSSLEVRLGHVTSDRCISVDREVPQGAPESPLVFVMVADEILGGLRPSQERRNFASTCDEVSLSCLGYADDVLLFSGSKASLEAMMEDCCVKFGEAGLEVGLDKSHWSSSTAMDGETLAVRGQNREWERKLEFLGSVIEPGAHSGGAVRHCTQKASSVFCKWQPLLCNPNVPLKERVKAFGAITLSSATWLSGCWTLSKQHEQASESWCARLLSQMVGFKRDPHDDFALSGESCTAGDTSWLKFSQAVQLICTFVQNTVSRSFCPF